MLTHYKNSEYIRQEVSHEDHFWCLPSQPNTQSGMYNGAARVSLMTDTSLSVPATTVIADKIMLYEDTMERHEYKDPNMKLFIYIHTKVRGGNNFKRVFCFYDTP